METRDLPTVATRLVPDAVSFDAFVLPTGGKKPVSVKVRLIWGRKLPVRF